jgi:hypothetical protein
LNVEIDGTEVPQAGDDGWNVDRSTDPPTIVLKGETCEHLETQGAEKRDHHVRLPYPRGSSLSRSRGPAERS